MTKFTPLFDLLQFPKKKRLEIYDVFWRFDKDGSGSIDFREFCQSFDIDRSAFAKRSFMMLDSGGTGEINFPQFVVACWNYCTYDKIGLASFAYMLYDPHRKGNIELKEMFQLLEDVYGFSKRGAAMDSQGTVNVVKNSPEYYMIQAKRGLKQCAGEDQLVSMVEFVNYSRTHPNLLQRPHTLQHKLQKTLGGEQFWAELTKIRRTMEKRAGVRGLNMLDAEVVISWLERETGTNLRSTNKPRKMKTTPGAVKHGGGNPYLPEKRQRNHLIDGGIANLVPSDWKIWTTDTKRVWCDVEAAMRGDCTHDYRNTAKEKALTLKAVFTKDGRPVRCRKNP